MWSTFGIIGCQALPSKQLSRSPGMEKNNLADLHSTLIANKWQEVEHHYPDFVRSVHDTKCRKEHVKYSNTK
jgi:hypothetical protein